VTVPRPARIVSGKAGVYPMRNESGELVLVKVYLYDRRPDDAAAFQHPSGMWCKVQPDD
jgi:hypothetical protein